jgi:hypothetical protein
MHTSSLAFGIEIDTSEVFALVCFAGMGRLSAQVNFCNFRVLLRSTYREQTSLVSVGSGVSYFARDFSRTAPTASAAESVRFYKVVSVATETVRLLPSLTIVLMTLLATIALKDMLKLQQTIIQQSIT